MIERPSARPSGRGAFQSHICATVSKHLRALGVAAMRSSRNSIGSMFASTAIWSMKLSMAKTLNTCATARQCLTCTPCDDAAQFELLVRHAVVGDPHAAGQQRKPPSSPITQCFQPVTLPLASVAASRHWNDCGRNRPWAMSSSRVQTSLTGRLTSRAISAASTASIAAVAPAEAAAEIALVVRDLLLLEAERLRHRRARDVGRLGAFPDLDVVAGIAHARHRVERLHLRVIAEVAPELGLVDLGGAGERRLGVALRLHGLGRAFGS